MPETTFDTLNLKACLFAISQFFDERGVELPVMVSVTITDASGRTLSGQTVEAFWNSVSHFPMLSVGLNCALGPDRMRPYLEELSRIAPCFVSCHPNAGLPNEFGGYDETPEQMRRVLCEFAENGWLNIVGGCCGTTPEHIRVIAEGMESISPRVRPSIPGYSRLSGLEPLTLRPEGNFIMVGERTNVTGSKKFARLVRSGDYEAALEVARDQVANGANVLDVNMDEALLDGEKAMSDLPAPHRLRARNRPRPADDRQLEVVGDRGGPQVRAGQEHRQLDQPEGGRASPSSGRPGSSAVTGPPPS